MSTRLINVSNRLPVTVADDGGVKKSSGGLVAALDGLPKDEFELLWLGWPGREVDDPDRDRVTKTLEAEHGCRPVFLSKELADAHYEGLSNSSIWPILHYMPTRFRYDAAWWDAYQEVNRLFADAVLAAAGDDDVVWVHDYQLMLLPKLLKDVRPSLRVGFFLHTPFPSYEVFRCHPNREALVEGVLGADLAGFHTFNYLRHFRSSAIRLLGAEADVTAVRLGRRTTSLGVYPIGINAPKFDLELASDGLRQEFAKLKAAHAGQKVVLSVERLDYTKGIVHRLEAIELYLRGRRTPRRRQVRVHRRPVAGERGGLQGAAGGDRVPGRPDERAVRHPERLAGAVHLRERDVHRAVRAVRAGRRGDGDPAGRRDEPGRQGVRGVPAGRRRAGRRRPRGAGAQRVRRGGRGAVRGGPRQPVRRGGRRGGDRPRAGPADGRAAAADGGHAAAGHVVRRPGVGPRVREGPDGRPARLARRPGNRRRPVRRGPAAPGRDRRRRPRRAVPRLRRHAPGDRPRPGRRRAPTPELRAVLDRLAGLANVDVTIVSGRRPEDLDRFLAGYDRFTLVAEHGATARPAGSDRWERHDVDDAYPWKEPVGRVLRAFEASTPGTWVEEKRTGLVWHYRTADPEFGAARAKDLVMELSGVVGGEPAVVRHGKKIVEVLSSRVSKGAFVARAVNGRAYDLVVAAGDDATDESMFRLDLPGRELLTIRVGPGDTAAGHRVGTPAELRAVLAAVRPGAGTDA